MTLNECSREDRKSKADVGERERSSFILRYLKLFKKKLHLKLERNTRVRE
jgi:hypothetical protein